MEVAGDLGRVQGRYRLRLNSIHATPESHGPLIDINDTTQGEAIDVSGDLDEFRFTARAGEYYTLFAQIPTGRSIWVDILDPAGGYLEQDYRQGDPVGLFDTYTGRLKIPADGEYRCGYSAGPEFGYPYELFLYRIDTLPSIRLP